MTVRKYYPTWRNLSSASIQSGTSWVTSSYDTKLASNVVFTYANARHNTIGVPYGGRFNGSFSGDSSHLVITPGDPGDNKAFMCIPVDGRVTFPGNLRVWLYGKTSSEVLGNAVRVTARIDMGSPQPLCSSHTTIHSLTTAWYSIDLTLPDIESTYLPEKIDGGWGGHAPLLSLVASLVPGIANTITIYCICAYQRTLGATPAHAALDTANAVYGTDDYPRSAAMSFKLQDEVNCVHNNRIPRSNVVSHWYPKYYEATPTSYPAAANTLGYYKFVKRAGCSAVYAYALVNEQNSVKHWDLKTTITSTVEGSQEVATIVNSAGPHYWVGSKFTFSAANAAAEKELEVMYCSETTSSGPLSEIFGVCIAEAPISASSVVHVVPNVSEYGGKSYVAAAQQKNEVNTITHIWKRQPAIAMSDYRFTIANKIQVLNCSESEPLKTDPAAPASNTSTSMVARCLAFPSYGCSRYKITLGCQTVMGVSDPETELAGEGPNIYLWFQLSDSTALNTYKWQGPNLYTDDAGDMGSTYGHRNIFGANDAGLIVTHEILPWLGAQAGGFRVTALTTPVSSGMWLTPTSTITAASLVQPLQFWIMAWTDHTANYVIPTYLTIDEIPLNESEFP